MESGNVPGKLSFENFIIYLLPGVIITLGIFSLTRLCDLHNYLLSNIDFFTGLLIVLVSFTIGIIFSGISDQIINFVYWILSIPKPSGYLVIKELQGELIDCFRSEFNIRVRKTGWREEHFFLVRNAVDHFMPEAAKTSHRQGSLQIIRGYLIFPVILWTIIGIVFSVKEIHNSQHQIILLLVVLAAGYFLTISLWLSMKKNTLNEVRNTLIAFVSLSKSGIMRDKTRIY